jgi:hypothetical protein
MIHSWQDSWSRSDYSEHKKYGDEMLFLLNTTPQTPIIHELKYRTFKHSFDSEIKDAIDSVICKCKHLKTLEFQLQHLRQNILMFMGQCQWSELIFKNVKVKDQEDVNNVLANHPEISTITLEYEWPIEEAFYKVIPSLQKIQFKFTDVRRTFNDLNKAIYLEIRRIDNNAQMEKIVNYICECVNLKVLRLNRISSRAKITSGLMKLLLTAVKNLEELHLDVYSDRLQIPTGTLETIKAEGKHLKKLTMTVDFAKVEKFREKMNIFNDTKVQAIVMGKIIAPTCLETAEPLKDDGYEPAVCIWKK